MQLICPTCGEPIKAENVNVQDMVAVCSACDNVFKFTVAESKAKRRKASQPSQLTMRDDDVALHMAFRTNFRLDKDESFLMFLIMSSALTIISLLMFGKFLDGELTVFLPLITTIIAMILYYVSATIAYNKTHVDMDDESIRVSRQPLPSWFNQARDINLSGVVSIYSEETPQSKKEAFDTPRYHVWAEMADGTRKVIVTDVIDDYAVFIAQRLQERLNMDADLDVSRLVDDRKIQQKHIIDEVEYSPQSTNQNQNL